MPRTGACLPICPVVAPEENTEISGIEFSPDGSILASAITCRPSGPRQLILWDLNSIPSKRAVIPNVESAQVVFSEDGQSLWAINDKNIQEIDVAAGEIRRTLKGHSAQVDALAVVPGRGQLISGGDDREVRLWDLSTGESTALGAELALVKSLGVDPAGKVFACGDRHGWISLREMDAPSGDRTYQGSDLIQAIAFEPDSRSLVLGGSTIQRLDVATTVAREISAAGLTLAVSADAKLAAIYDSKDRIEIWDIGAKQLIVGWKVGAIDHAALSATGNLLATWTRASSDVESSDYQMNVWDTRSGELVAHPGWYGAGAAAFAPKSRTVGDERAGIARSQSTISTRWR